ncbi:DsbA family protein [Sphingomonas sp. RRHST34]|uniref:DsbA family protein n=1 Tax=Sphingomonas citri TaxID=2862499 RepID=A0ABS7BSS7_9SPHN|nr:DsbA family protein [Sphingomonas citri]MBW6532660.1 DsbA family protein [Sphingomonas citri]
MLKIDLYTDVSCPWCILGMYRLDKVLAERFSELKVDIEHHPVLLMPDAPAAGVHIPDMLRSRYGVTDPRQAFARPEMEARASGLGLDLSRQPWAYPTQPAHALISAARERGTQHKLAVAISNAYFLEAKNTSDPDILAEIGAANGFDRDEARAIALNQIEHHRVEQESAEASRKGVRSVPHFIFDDRLAINGGRSEDEIERAIRQGLEGKP